MKVAFFNLILRGLAISGRFLVLIGIGRYLSEGDLGVYGLFYSTIILSLYFIGLDFYTFTTREIIAADTENRFRIIRNQFTFHIFSYIIILPILLLVFLYDLIPLRYMVWFYVVLIFEHISQELFRIFIAISHSVFANFIAFVRSGLWVLVLAALWLLHLDFLINLDTVLIFWGAGSILSVVIAFIYLKFILRDPLPGEGFNWQWTKKGLITALPFFIGSLCYKIIEHANRYFIDHFQGKELVGIFTFFGGIANVVTVVVNTAIIIVAYPKLYEFYIQKDWNKYFNERRRFYLNTLWMSIGTGLLLLLVIDPLITFIGKDAVFYPHINTFYLLVLANVILNISMIPHFILYIQKRDFAIMAATLAGMVINIILNYFLIRSNGIAGAAVSMIISILVIGIIKFYMMLRTPSHTYES